MRILYDRLSYNKKCNGYQVAKKAGAVKSRFSSIY